MIRLTQTDKWEDRWFCRLSPEAKLLFLYLCDACDSAGFWEINLNEAAYRTGLQSEDNTPLINASMKGLTGAFDELKSRFIIEGDVLWIKNFIEHQRNLPLNEENLFHKSIIKRLLSRNTLSKKAIKYLKERCKQKGLPSPYSNSNSNSNYKNKYSKKEKETLENPQKKNDGKDVWRKVGKK